MIGTIVSKVRKSKTYDSDPLPWFATNIRIEHVSRDEAKTLEQQGFGFVTTGQVVSVSGKSHIPHTHARATIRAQASYVKRNNEEQWGKQLKLECIVRHATSERELASIIAEDVPMIDEFESDKATPRNIARIMWELFGTEYDEMLAKGTTGIPGKRLKKKIDKLLERTGLHMSELYTIVDKIAFMNDASLVRRVLPSLSVTLANKIVTAIRDVFKANQDIAAITAEGENIQPWLNTLRAKPYLAAQEIWWRFNYSETKQLDKAILNDLSDVAQPDNPMRLERLTDLHLCKYLNDKNEIALPCRYLDDVLNRMLSAESESGFAFLKETFLQVLDKKTMPYHPSDELTSNIDPRYRFVLQFADDNHNQFAQGDFLWRSETWKQAISIAEHAVDADLDYTNAFENFERRVDRHLDDYEEESDIKLDPTQRAAVHLSIRKRVSIIRGGPGCGKTTVVRAITYVHEKLIDDLQSPLRRQGSIDEVLALISTRRQNRETQATITGDAIDAVTEDALDDELRQTLKERRLFDTEMRLLFERRANERAKHTDEEGHISLAWADEADQRLEHELEQRKSDNTVFTKTKRSVAQACAVSCKASQRISESNGPGSLGRDYNDEMRVALDDEEFNATNTVTRMLMRGVHPKCNLLIADEASMLSIGDAAELMRAFFDRPEADHAVSAMIFVGDEAQLPPIGLGTLFADMIQANTVPMTELRVQHRVDNANKTNLVEILHQARSGNVSQLVETNDVKLIGVQRSMRANREIDDVSIQNIISAYQSELARNDGDPSRILLITPRNKDVNLLNKTLQSVQNPNGEFILRYQQSVGRQVNEIEFRVGDRVLCKKNDYGAYIYYEKNGKRIPEERALANGDLATIVSIRRPGRLKRKKHQTTESAPNAETQTKDKDTSLALESGTKTQETTTVILQLDATRDEAGTHYMLEIEAYKLAPNASNEITWTHGWAITVHASQGSEAPSVMFVMPDVSIDYCPSSFWSRPMGYTAMTRAKSSLVIAAPPTTLQQLMKRIVTPETSCVTILKRKANDASTTT